ncbi:GGDEF domain-containing protein [Marinimicrobium agarilyticum]|uniref:GGDEF domain-containing protein n=1 Tax=Marinimicrobium agarilyticum TaxID=306546 RepID=UPI0004104785|nr:sensor domain-containing diguanylate cyclase [Marinimicrobium agarilyticum]
MITEASAAGQPIQFVNPAFEELTGYSANEAIGRDCRFLQDTDCDQTGLVTIRNAIAGGSEAKVMLRNYRKDGTLFINELSIAPVYGETGVLTHFIGIQNDVTLRESALKELRRAREELEERVQIRTAELSDALVAIRQSEERIREIAETAPGVVYQWYKRLNGDMGFYYVSPRTEDLFGLTPETFLLEWTTLVHPDDLLEMSRSIGSVELYSTHWSYELRVRGPDGDWRWVRLESRAVKRTDTEVVFSGIITDVTEEEALKRELANNERRFRSLAEGSIQAVVVCAPNAGNSILFANSAAALLFGFSDDQELCQNYSLDKMAIVPAEREEDKQWRQLLNGNIESVQLRAEARTQTGKEIWIDLVASTVHWDEAPALQVTMVDASERHQLEEDMRRLASLDPLTNLNNRRQFNVLANQELQRQGRYHEDLTVLTMDIDYFKNINDQYGHAGGDAALRAFAGLLRQQFRESDIVGRLGGEEFAVLLLKADLNHTAVIAERLREACSDMNILYEGKTIRMTTSIGIARCKVGEHSIELPLKRADGALYAAKNDGRNCVKIYYG